MIRAFHWSLTFAVVVVALVCCASCRDTDTTQLSNRPKGNQPNQDWEQLNNKAVELHVVGKYTAAVWDAAINDLSTAIELNPTPDRQYFMMRGTAWHSKGKVDLAMKDLDRAIEIDPDFSMAYCLRAGAKVQMGDFDDARLDYKRSIQLDPSNDLAHDRLAWLLSTCPDDAIRDGAVALEHAQQANELREWIDYHYWDSLAAYAETGQFEKAVEWIEQAQLESPPQDRAELKLQLESYKAKQPFRDLEVSRGMK